MAYKKEFIGSGKKGQYSTRVSIDLAKAKPHIYEYNGKKYLTFELAEKQETDQYGKTHSAYVVLKDKEDKTNNVDKSEKWDNKNNVEENDDLPF